MKTIWKYQIEAMVQVLEMPEGAEVLTVQLQDETITLWAIVDTEKPKESRRFEVIGTGHSIEVDVSKDSQLIYISTVQNKSKRLVWHIFERL